MRGDAYLINYSKRNVFMISLIISLCIFVILNFSFNEIYKIYGYIKDKTISVVQEENKGDNQEIMKATGSKEKESETTKDENIEDDIWQIEISKINLSAPISEGTSQEVMLEFVGHFESTSKWNGNVGLAAHNRGYPINYFSRLKELKNEDKIIYKTKYGTKTYAIKIIKIIEDTDWSYLQETKENRITLITCVENKPSQRLCIQGIEIKEE